MDDKLTEAVAKVELGMRTIQVVIGERRLSVGIDSEAERFANDLAAAWNASTEAKVSGDHVAWGTIYSTFTDAHDSWSAESGKSRIAFAIDAVYALQLPAPQSPVVPGVEELSRVFMKGARSNWTKPDNPHDADDQPLSIDDGIKAIQAHLLANARESGEGRYRKYSDELNLMAKEIREFGGDFQENSDDEGTCMGWAWNLEEIARALATVGKEG